MRITQDALTTEICDKAIRLYWMRVIGVVVVFSTYFLGTRLSGFSGYSLSLFVLGVVEIGLNVPFPFYFKTSERAFKFLATSVMVDLVAETLMIHFIGGIDAMFFSAVYLLSILYCAINLPSSLNFIMATLASLLYGGLIAAEYFDVVPHWSALDLRLSGLMQLSIVISHIAFFYLIAFAARFLAQALIEKEERLRQLLAEVREANQRIKYAHRMKSEFIAHVSHELRSPLNTVLGFAGLLSEPEIGPLNEAQKNYAERIRFNAQHLLEVINDVLDISKIEAQKTVMNWQETNLVELVQQASEVFYEEALRKRLQVDFENRAGENLMVWVDVRKMRQTFYNLLSNAIKFTPQGGRIHLSLEKKPSSAQIVFTDTGIGLTPDEQTRIFNPYAQVGLSSHEMEGTGLGLAITKKFVELHGGTIRVESRPHEGARFVIDLPLRVPGVQPAPQGAPEGVL